MSQRVSGKTIEGYREKMREAMERASAFSAAWNQRNEELKRINSDPGQLQINGSSDLALMNAMAGHGWWSGEAQRYAAAIQAEFAAAQLLGRYYR